MIQRAPEQPGGTRTCLCTGVTPTRTRVRRDFCTVAEDGESCLGGVCERKPRLPLHKEHMLAVSHSQELQATALGGGDEGKVEGGWDGEEKTSECQQL